MTNYTEAYEEKRRDNLTFKSTEFISANIIEVSVATNTPMGGDSGHGGLTIIQFKDHASTHWAIRNLDTGEMVDLTKGFELILCGDCEADTITDALAFAGAVLKCQMCKNVRSDNNGYGKEQPRKA